MKKIPTLFTLLIVGLLSCGGSEETQPETTEPTSCRIISFTNDFGQVMNYEYNEKGLVASIHYQLASNTGTLLLTWDEQKRLTKMSSANTDISIAYDENGMTVNNQYTPRQGATVAIAGSGEVRFNLNADKRVSTMYKNDMQINKIEYNADGLMEKFYYGPSGEETLWAEIPSYDDKINPLQNLLFSFFISFPNNEPQVFWQYQPWDTNEHNATKVLVYTNSGISESTTNFQYNDLGYPISNSGTVKSTYTYSCE